MGGFLFIVAIVIVVVCALIKIFSNGRERDGYDKKGNGNYNRGSVDLVEPKPQKNRPRLFSIFKSHKEEAGYSNKSPFCIFRYNNKAINWCAVFFSLSRSEFEQILGYIPQQYKCFKMRKRSGGFRTISAPEGKLLEIQQHIYYHMLQPVPCHPAATGFRQGKSIVDNVRPHLGKKQILKTDLHDFFGSIHQHRVKSAFEQIGYPVIIAEILAQLCCLQKCLPQGSPASPALSNIIASRMDDRLVGLAKKYNLTYTRYADDLTFSGDFIPEEDFLSKLNTIVLREGFALNVKKTRFIGESGRKIVTGVSISSGVKLTIPKKKKREIRKNVYFVLTKGVAEHQRAIGSRHPAYVKCLLGQLSYWLSVEPDNQYVRKSIKALKKLPSSR